MPMKRWWRTGAQLALVLCVLFVGHLASYAIDLSPEGLMLISPPASPKVSCVLDRTAQNLRVTFYVQSLTPDGQGITIDLGLAAAHQVTRSMPAKPGTSGVAFCVFDVPVKTLIDTPADWTKMRMGVAVRWGGGALGQDRLRERLLHATPGAPHAGLSPRAEDWALFDLTEYETAKADLKQQIRIAFDQPMDGKATVVIEDASGNRVRNLISGVTMSKGSHTITWNGMDDNGNFVKPGAYRWRSIHHPGITPEYLMSFCNADNTGFNGLMSNHCHFIQATSNGQYVFFAAVGTEGGYAMMALDKNGSWKHGYNHVLGLGWDGVALAADDRYLYVVNDGIGWGTKVDRLLPDWKVTVPMSLIRYDIETGTSVDYVNRQRYQVLEQYEYGPGAPNEIVRQRASLSGVALFNGKLYVGSRNSQMIFVVDPATGQKVGQFPLAQPGPIAAGADALYAVSGTSLVQIDPANGATHTVMAFNQLKPRGITVDQQGNIYISDELTNTVKVFTSAGAPVRTIGKPGGEYTGPYDPERMVAPTGLTVMNGRLWVAEDRTDPKRAMAWDLATNKVVVQQYGNPPYGGSGAGFDPQNASRWLGLGASWSIDMKNKTAECRSVLGFESGAMHYRFFYQDGRTYVVAMAKATYLCSWQNDGTLRPFACIAGAHTFSYSQNWTPPQGFVEAYNKAFPDKKYVPGTRGKPDHGVGMLWVDRNGDGEMQAEEFEFTPANSNMAGGGWGHDQYDLTIRVPGIVNGKNVIVVLKPNGFTAQGVPQYPHLSEALASAVPMDTVPSKVNTITDSTVDRFGDLLLKSTPVMTCYGPDGHLRWSYPNPWSDVHGSHDAPLPEVGVMQGTLFFLGTAPLDATSDVFMMNGNHGRHFILTSDGLYLDEMFNDVRVSFARDAMLVGGECFGGVFGKANDGQYYLATGGSGFRIYRINGLQQAVRHTGNMAITPAQLMAAERSLKRKQQDTPAIREASATYLAKAPKITGAGTGWPTDVTLSWQKSGQFPVQVKCAYDAENLYLTYDVRDDSPWVNNGTDWTLLFKTGDSVDLQLGTNPAAPAGRKGPVPGDLRLLIAPCQGKDIAVLYRHRVPGAARPVSFTSPWREEKVDIVERLDSARIVVKRNPDNYHVEAAIPLNALGLTPDTSKTYKADFGVIYGDRDGTVNLLRSYWSNQATGLVNDVPGEIMLSPNMWGTIRFAEKENN